VNEWGFHLVKSGDGTMGHPVEPVYRELPRAVAAVSDRQKVGPDRWAGRNNDTARPAVAPYHDNRRSETAATAEAIRVPALREEERMSAAPAFFEKCEDRYRLASFDLSGFTVYTFLRGFENAMQDFLLEPAGFAALMDKIVDWECDLMRMAARHGFHGIHFADDWGTQSGMMISPPLWRELFKPRYARQFALAHELGLHTWYHCCGEFVEIMEDFREIGVDVLNISQPNVNDIAAVGRRLRGRQCFLMPISYQTVSISGTPADIYAEAERLHRLLGTPDGGFIGYVEEYSVMGMSERNYRACGEAFRRLQHSQVS
jgi:hypothetical protein